MTSYLLRGVDDDLWTRVKVRAANDRITIRTAIVLLLKLYAAGKISL